MTLRIVMPPPDCPCVFAVRFARTLRRASADCSVPVDFMTATTLYWAGADSTAPLSSRPTPRTPAALARVIARVLGFISLPLCGFELLETGRQAVDGALQRRVLLGELLHGGHR